MLWIRSSSFHIAECCLPLSGFTLCSPINCENLNPSPMNVLINKLIQKLLTGMAQLIFTLLLTIVLGYCVLKLAPVKWILHSEMGSSINLWLMASMSANDLKDILDTFTLIWLSMVPSFAIWICVLLTRYLKQKKDGHPVIQIPE